MFHAAHPAFPLTKPQTSVVLTIVAFILVTKIPEGFERNSNVNFWEHSAEGRSFCLLDVVCVVDVNIKSCENVWMICKPKANILRKNFENTDLFVDFGRC